MERGREAAEGAAFDGAFAIAGATKGAATVSFAAGTEDSAGAVERNSSSAPGKLALRVIVRLPWQLVREQVDDMKLRHRMMMRN